MLISTRAVLSRWTAPRPLFDLVLNVLLTEPAASQAHLAALGDLVGSVHCHRLFAGRDLGHLAALVGALAD